MRHDLTTTGLSLGQVIVIAQAGFGRLKKEEGVSHGRWSAYYDYRD